MRDDDWELEFAPAEPEEGATSVSDHVDELSFLADDSTAKTLAEIDRLQQQKTNWGATLLVLFVSGLLFYLIGRAAWNWKTVALLIPILLFHELGHYVAMLAFGYRNLRMFFIPLFGAAVTGRNYNVAAWKKAVVSLMGPLPGIGLGVVLGIVAIFVKQNLLLEAAGLMVFINGMNLLPLLPLDGGWNLHSLLFSRHYILDVGFRLVAAVLMMLGGIALHEYFLAYLGIAMLFGLPLEYRRSQVVGRLRREGFAARSLDSQTIPEATARRIIAEIDASYPHRMSYRATARLTLQIFESMNARPAGIIAIMTLGGLHAAAFVVALAFSIFFFIRLHAKPQPVNPLQFLPPTVALPMHAAPPGPLPSWRGARAGASATARETLIGTFADRKQGEAAFHAVTAKLPPEASAELFGQSLLITLSADQKIEQTWTKELQSRCQEVRTDKAKAFTAWTFTVVTPSEEAATALQQELNQYLSFSHLAFLIPPWSPQSLTSEQRLARTTYAKVGEAQARLYCDPEYRAKSAELFKQLGKDKDAFAKAEQELGRIRQEKLAQAVAQVRREEKSAVDFKTLDLYAVAAASKNQWGQQSVPGPDPWVDVWRRLGTLPLEKGKPRADADRFSALSGHVERVGSRLRLRWVSFAQLNDGLPALTQWLSDKHCVDLKYRIEPTINSDEDELD